MAKGEGNVLEDPRKRGDWYEENTKKAKHH